MTGRRSNVNIHIIEKTNKFTKLQDDVWESGWWRVDEGNAQKLVGGEIYFHRKRLAPSFYGGTILGYRVEPEGKYQGRIVFQIRHNQACRDVRTDKSGWSREVKIIGLEQ